MQNFLFEKFNTTRRVIFVAGTFLISAALCFRTAPDQAGFFSAGILFYIPIAFSFFFFGITVTAFLAGITLLILAVNLFWGSPPHLLPIVLATGIAANYFFWYRWTKGKNKMEFQFSKTLDELEFSVNEGQVSYEKIRMVYLANQIKIQKYTALNELARNLAMTFKIQEVVVLLAETISKTFMVPGGVYSLLLFDSSIGKGLHIVRYSVDTDMGVRLNRERLNPSEPLTPG